MNKTTMIFKDGKSTLEINKCYFVGTGECFFVSGGGEMIYELDFGFGEWAEKLNWMMYEASIFFFRRITDAYENLDDYIANGPTDVFPEEGLAMHEMASIVRFIGYHYPHKKVNVG